MYGAGSANLDNSWNEIDQTFVNGGSGGLEFHGSLFLSNPSNPSNAQEDKDVFDNTGVNCNSYVPAKGQPGNLKGNLGLGYTCPLFSTQTAAQYHTYKLVWTPTWLAWTVDNIVYRNSTASPWRPVTMRPLLRTNVGTAASVQALPDAQIYVRRVRYTRLDAAGLAQNYGASQVINDAFNCVSMAACYGPLSATAAGLIQVQAASGSGTSAGRRRLMQGDGPVLDVNGNIMPISVGATPVNPYLTELAAYTNATQVVVAGVLPGILPNQVMVTITGHTISGTILISGNGVNFASWTSSVQSAFVNGLANDVVPTPDMVFVSNTYDASLGASWAAIGTPPPSPLTPGILVTYNVDGYVCPAVINVTSPCLDAGYSVAAGDQAILDAIGPSSATYRTLRTALNGPTSFTVSDQSPCITAMSGISTCTSGGGGEPLIAVTVGVGIDIITPPSTNGSNSDAGSGSSGSLASDLLEALFDSALNSGIISTALTNAGIGTANPPSNVQTARAVRASSVGICIATTPTDASTAAAIAAAAAASASANEKVYLGIMAAFIAAFGVGIPGAFCAGMYMTKQRGSRYGEMSGKIPDTSAGQELYLEQRAASGRSQAANSLKTYA